MVSIILLSTKHVRNVNVLFEPDAVGRQMSFMRIGHPKSPKVASLLRFCRLAPSYNFKFFLSHIRSAWLKEKVALGKLWSMSKFGMLSMMKRKWCRSNAHTTVDKKSATRFQRSRQRLEQCYEFTEIQQAKERGYGIPGWVIELRR